MIITEVIKTTPGDILALCMGDDINAHFSCKKIMINGKEFSVKKANSMMSFSGNMCAVLFMDAEQANDIPTGPFTIVQ